MLLPGDEDGPRRTVARSGKLPGWQLEQRIVTQGLGQGVLGPRPTWLLAWLYRLGSQVALEDGLGDQRHQRQARKQRRQREGRGRLVVVVAHLVSERQRVGEAADVA